MRYFSGLIAIFLLLMNGPAFSQGYWKMMPPIPTERSEVTATELDGKIYVVGGFTPKGETNKVEKFDIATGIWTEIAPLPQTLHHASLVACNKKLYVIGGFTGRWWSPLDTIYEFDSIQNKWTQKAPMPSPRGALTATVVGGKIYALGGAYKSPKITTTFFGLINSNANEEYDPQNDTWTQRAPLPTPRDHLTSSVVNKVIHVIGGRINIDYSLPVEDNEAYDPVKDLWTKNCPLPTPRSGLGSQVLEGKVFVFGGESQKGTYNHNEAFDPNTNTWEKRSTMIEAVHGFGVAIWDKTIHLLAGGPKPGLGGSQFHQVFSIQKFK